jgi:hypothetical protein
MKMKGNSHTLAEPQSSPEKRGLRKTKNSGEQHRCNSLVRAMLHFEVLNHTCNLRRLRQEDREFKISLGYIERPVSNREKGGEVIPRVKG